MTISLQRINQMILLGCIGVFLYILVGWVESGNHPEQRIASRFKNREAINSPNVKVIQLSDLTKRNFFHPLIASAPPPPPPPKVVELPPAVPPPPKIPLSQKASTLRLVGIMNSDPLQAIIEDQEHQKTLTLTAGESIGDIQIQKIFKDHVVLFSADEQMELQL